MPTTRIAEMLQSTPYREAAIAESLRKSVLYSTGAVAENADISAALAAMTNNTYHLDYFDDLADTGTVVGSDSPTATITPDKITTSRQTGIIMYRNKAWEAADLASRLSTTGDPMSAILSRISPFWGREYDYKSIAVATGVKADNIANDSGDMVYSIYSDIASPAASNLISIDSIIKAKATIGDRSDEFTTMVMHSKQYHELEIQGYVDKIYDDNGVLLYRQAAGMNLVISDSVEVVAGTNSPAYTCYIFQSGAFGIGTQASRVGDTTDRDEAAGNGSGIETLYTRRHFSIHPIGFSWTGGTDANANPSDADLIAASSWNRVDDRKRCKIAYLVSN